jgi:hypothetical protein
MEIEKPVDRIDKELILYVVRIISKLIEVILTMKTLDDKTRNLLLAIKKLLDSIKDESENDGSSRDKIAEDWQKLTQLLSLIYNLIPTEIRDQLVREFFQGLITNTSNADLDQILLNLKTRKSLFENVPNGQHYSDIVDNLFGNIFDNFLNIRSQQPQQPKQKKSIPFFSKIKQILPSLSKVPKTKVVNLFKSSVSAIKRGTNLILFSKDRTGEKEQKIQTGKDINPIDGTSVTTVTKADAGTSITTGASAEIKGNPETGIGNTKIITPNSNLSLKERQESLLNSEEQKRKELEEQERKRKDGNDNRQMEREKINANLMVEQAKKGKELKKLSQWKSGQQEINKKLKNKIKEKTIDPQSRDTEGNQSNETYSPIDNNYDFGMGGIEERRNVLNTNIKQSTDTVQNISSANEEFGSSLKREEMSQSISSRRG